MRGATTPRPSADETPGAALPGAQAGMVRVEEEVVRDLRHSVGNYFHKLYYWLDRIGSEDQAAARGEQVEELGALLQRFQEFLELGLRYFQADRASPIEMKAAEVASASASVLETEFPGVDISIDVADDTAERAVRLDPQRFSLALRLVADLLGGTKRERIACALATSADHSALEVTIEAAGGDSPLETPVMEWAIARKTMSMQGGVLQASPGREDAIGGCVMRLPLGK